MKLARQFGIGTSKDHNFTFIENQFCPGQKPETSYILAAGFLLDSGQTTKKCLWIVVWILVLFLLYVFIVCGNSVL